MVGVVIAFALLPSAWATYSAVAPSCRMVYTTSRPSGETLG